MDDPPKYLGSPIKYLHRVKRDMFEKNSRYVLVIFLWHF